MASTVQHPSQSLLPAQSWWHPNKIIMREVVRPQYSFSRQPAQLSGQLQAALQADLLNLPGLQLEASQGLSGTCQDEFKPS